MTTTQTPARDDAGFLTTLTMRKLGRFFAEETSHRPSPAVMDALQDVVSTFENMALGTAAPKFYLSSLDPGLGKSSAIVSFVDTLVSRPEFAEVGVLLCINRLDEIAAMAQRMGLPKEFFGVLSSDRELNKLGVGIENIGSAQVLFSTHAQVELRCQGRSFADVAAFHYRGRPRAVRVWDEACLPGRTLTLSVDDLGVLPRLLRPSFPEIVAPLYELQEAVRKAPDGSTYEVPDLTRLTGVDENGVLQALQGRPEDERLIASGLWYLSGKVVTVRRDGIYGNTALDYRDTLPEDIAPLVVTDASGRVRGTYAQWEARRGNLVRLKAAPKDYRALNVHVWRRSGGKSAFGSDAGRVLVEGIAATINSKPEEEWLLVCHRPRSGRRGFDVERSVRELLSGPQDRLKVVTWGRHEGTNKFSTIRNVVLGGTLFLRASAIESLTRASAGLPSSAGRVSLDDIREVALGESRHQVLQAGCRGSVRNSDGDACQPCDLYVIAAAGSGIPTALPNIFPQCRISPWRPVKEDLKGKAGHVAKLLNEWAEWGQLEGQSASREFLPFKDVMRLVGYTNAANFKKDIRRHPALQEVIAGLELVEDSRDGKGKYPKGWRLFDPCTVFDDEDAKQSSAPEAVQAGQF